MVSCVQFESVFLVFGTQSGSLFMYYIGDNSPTFIEELVHPEGGITRIWVNKLGTRIIFEDERHVVYFYNPLKHQIQQISASSGQVEEANWNHWDPHIFSLTKPASNHAYLYTSVTKGVKKLPHSVEQLSLAANVVVSKEDTIEQTKAKAMFEDNLSMAYFDKAWIIATMMKDNMIWETLAGMALKHLELQTAMKACEESKNVVNLSRLYHMEDVEDKKILSAKVLKLLHEYPDAFKCYRKSLQNGCACKLLCHLQNWNQVVETIHADPSFSSSLPTIYGHFLEVHDQKQLAYSSYEKELKSCDTKPTQKTFAQIGITRLSIQFGDLWKGHQMATTCNDSTLFCDCAMVLNKLNLYQDAAEFYELGHHFQVALMIYIGLKKINKIVQIFQRIFSPKLLIDYAKYLEDNEKFEEACTSYEQAEDFVNMIQIQLQHLKNPTKAFAILRKVKSNEGAALVTLFCKNSGNYEGAIEFLIMQKKVEEANVLAKQHGLVNEYFDLVKDVASNEECCMLAKYYESIGVLDKASTMFYKCEEYKQALGLLLQLGTHKAMETAIDMVGELKQDKLTNQLLDYFMGEIDQRGLKGLQYIFSLHIVLGNYEQATKAASQIATQEQDMGNYKVAHQQLQQFCKILRSKIKYVPPNLLMQLMLLHSYILVKTWICLGDHRSSARMLIRVAQHIDKFPAHTNPILISTVIECQRAGLKTTAYSYASKLLQQEHRESISHEHKRILANIVRKYEDVEENEPLSPCPFCQFEIPETQLDCVACGSTIPFCIATGRHLVQGNWSQCPSCKFPALMNEFLKVIEVEKVCPMCLETVNVDEVHKILEPLLDAPHLKLLS